MGLFHFFSNLYSGESKDGRLLFTFGVLTYIMANTYSYYNKKIERSYKRKVIKNKRINIGAIFGMDVGGTLAKLIYFEKDSLATSNSTHGSDGSIEPINRYQSEESTLSTSSSTTTTTTADITAQHSMKRSNSFARLDNPEYQDALNDIKQNILAMDQKGIVRDELMSFYCPSLGGKMHFFYFESRNMEAAIGLLGGYMSV